MDMYLTGLFKLVCHVTIFTNYLLTIYRKGTCNILMVPGFSWRMGLSSFQINYNLVIYPFPPLELAGFS